MTVASHSPLWRHTTMYLSRTGSVRTYLVGSASLILDLVGTSLGSFFGRDAPFTDERCEGVQLPETDIAH